MSNKSKDQLYLRTSYIHQMERWWNNQVIKSDIKGTPLPGLKELKNFRKK